MATLVLRLGLIRAPKVRARDRKAHMSEFTFEEQATAWEVRRVAFRGRPHSVYTAEGLPLFLPITAGIDDLRRSIETPGLYVLRAVDEQRRRIEGLPTVSLSLEPSPAHGDARSPGRAVAATDAPLDELAALARTSQALAKQILAHVPLLLDAAQGLLRIAEDADDVIMAIRDLIK